PRTDRRATGNGCADAVRADAREGAAARPWGALGPSWSPRAAGELRSDWASVLATTKSTPRTPPRIRLATALPPAPPTPTTLIRGRSSSSSEAISITIQLSLFGLTGGRLSGRRRIPAAA